TVGVELRCAGGHPQIPRVVGILRRSTRNDRIESAGHGGKDPPLRRHLRWLQRGGVGYLNVVGSVKGEGAPHFPVRRVGGGRGGCSGEEAAIVAVDAVHHGGAAGGLASPPSNHSSRGGHTLIRLERAALFVGQQSRVSRDHCEF